MLALHLHPSFSFFLFNSSLVSLFTPRHKPPSPSSFNRKTMQSLSDPLISTIRHGYFYLSNFCKKRKKKKTNAQSSNPSFLIWSDWILRIDSDINEKNSYWVTCTRNVLLEILWFELNETQIWCNLNLLKFFRNFAPFLRDTYVCVLFFFVILAVTLVFNIFRISAPFLSSFAGSYFTLTIREFCTSGKLGHFNLLIFNLLIKNRNFSKKYFEVFDFFLWGFANFIIYVKHYFAFLISHVIMKSFVTSSNFANCYIIVRILFSFQVSFAFFASIWRNVLIFLHCK